MTNTIAIWLGGLIVVAVVIDAALLEGTLPILAMRGVSEAVHFLAFWR